MRSHLLPPLMILAAAGPLPAGDTSAWLENRSRAAWRYEALEPAPVLLVVQHAGLGEAPHHTRFLHPGEPCAGSVEPGDRATFQVAAIGDLALDLPFDLIDDRGARRAFTYRVRKTVDYEADTLEVQGLIGLGEPYSPAGSLTGSPALQAWAPGIPLLEDRLPLSRRLPPPILGGPGSAWSPWGGFRVRLGPPPFGSSVKPEPLEIGNPRVEPVVPPQGKAGRPPVVRPQDKASLPPMEQPDEGLRLRAFRG